MNKVQDGTPLHSENLCESCSQCAHFTGHAVSQDIRICQAVYESPMRLTYPIYKCTEYLRRKDPTLRDMKEIAWIVRTSVTGNTIGFYSPQQFKDKHPDEDVIDI